jgi:hypothetical protein
MLRGDGSRRLEKRLARRLGNGLAFATGGERRRAALPARLVLDRAQQLPLGGSPRRALVARRSKARIDEAELAPARLDPLRLLRAASERASSLLAWGDHQIFEDAGIGTLLRHPPSQVSHIQVLSK